MKMKNNANGKGAADLYVKIAVVAVLVLAVFLIFSRMQPRTQLDFSQQAELKKFSSESELKQFLQENQQQFAGGYYALGAAQVATATRTESAVQQGAPAPSAGEKAASAASAEDYSATNVQVAGVDEADYVKNDGKYIYTISGTDVVIVDAFPAGDMQIVSTINLSDSSPSQIYVNGDRLVVFGNNYNYYGGPVPLGIAEGGAAVGSAGSGMAVPGSTGVAEKEVLQAEQAVAEPSQSAVASIASPRIVGPYYQPSSYIKVYDISDRSSPALVRDIELNGTYYDSRMIGNYVYAIVNSQPYYLGNDYVIPQFVPEQQAFPDVYYFPVPYPSYQFTNIMSINVNDDESGQINSKVFLLGYSTNLFVSQDNIYLVYQKQVPQDYLFNRILDEIIIPVAPPDVVEKINAIMSSDKTSYEKQAEIQQVFQEWQQRIGPEEAARLGQQFQDKYQQIQIEISKELEKSVVHKISISSGNIEYKAKGEVPGQPLNQFSMDEYNGYFRIATTTGGWQGESLNHVYVLDGGMNVVGKLEDLAKGERIYSARFMGDRAYLVTFVRIDPLFVIDLSDPTAPRVLGELKIPGVSEYLHPYDENYLIGVGRATEDIKDRVTFKGLKISLFDVSDVANPKEVAKYEIGEQGTYSEVLTDHKTFLFSKEKNLLVLPVIVYEMKSVEPKITEGGGEVGTIFPYPQPGWQGAYVFSLTPQDGFALKGTITHADLAAGSDYYYYYGPYSITRSLYMDDALYTLSQKAIKANALPDLSEISTVNLPGFSPVQIYYK